MTGLEWQADAACTSADPRLFETDTLTGRGAKQRMAMRESSAKAICADCPVRDKCLEYGIDLAIDNDIVEGIWGGKNPQEMADMLGVTLRFSSGIKVFEESAA